MCDYWKNYNVWNSEFELHLKEFGLYIWVFLVFVFYEVLNSF